MLMKPSERLDAGSTLDPALSPRNQAEYDAVQLKFRILDLCEGAKDPTRRIHIKDQAVELEECSELLLGLLNDIWRNDA